MALHPLVAAAPALLWASQTSFNLVAEVHPTLFTIRDLFVTRGSAAILADVSPSLRITHTHTYTQTHTGTVSQSHVQTDDATLSVVRATLVPLGRDGGLANDRGDGCALAGDAGRLPACLQGLQNPFCAREPAEFSIWGHPVTA